MPDTPTPDPTPTPDAQTPPPMAVIHVYQAPRPDCCLDCSGERPRHPIRFLPH